MEERANSGGEVDAVRLGSIELQALQMLSKGHSVQCIAKSTALSVNTVKLVLSSVRKKLACKSLAQVVSRAYSLGILS